MIDSRLILVNITFAIIANTTATNTFATMTLNCTFFIQRLCSFTESNKVKSHLQKPAKWRLRVGNISAIYPSWWDYLIPQTFDFKFTFYQFLFGRSICKQKQSIRSLSWKPFSLLKSNPKRLSSETYFH